MRQHFFVALALAAAASFAGPSAAAGRSHIASIEITERVRPAFGGRSVTILTVRHQRESD